MKHVLLALALLPAAVYSQVGTAELAGSVIDSTGAAVPAAAIKITNKSTGVSRDIMSDANGSYVLTPLQPGVYTITIEKSGFRKLVENNLELQVDQRARLDFTLQVGQVTETLEVAAAAPLLESQSSSIGSVVSQQQVNELPLNGRNFVQLAILTPGVNGTGYSVGGTIMSGTRPDDRRPGSEIFSNGNREGANNFLYDGVDNNERLTISIVLRPAVEAVREFKVQTNLFAADLGRNSGAVVDVVTKSGTNSLHGSLFEFLRNSAMDSRPFFSPKGTFFPPFRFNQFGFSLGGPIELPKLYNGKNKTFFFFDYEGYRRSSLNAGLQTIPTLAMRTGDFSAENRIFDPLTNTAGPNGTAIRTQFPNNQIPLSRFDPVTAKLIVAYPQPLSAGRINNYLASLVQTQNWDQGDVRVDHQISQRDNFFARWSIQNTSTITPNTFPAVTLPGIAKPVSLGDEASFAGTSFAPTQHAVASWVRVISPRLVNEFRAGFNRFRLDYVAEGADAGAVLGNLLGVKNANGHPLQNAIPIFSPASYTGIGQSRSLPIFRRENTFQYIDNVSLTLGSHTLKWGGDVRRRQITEYQTNRGNGRFNFSQGLTQLPGTGNTGNSIASFLLGLPTLIEQDYTLAWVGMRGIETGLYFADDYRVSKRLTINLGMRFEYQSPYSEVANRWASFDAATATIKIAGQDGVDSRAGVNRYFGGWSPRFGFAYQADEHTVIRGGFGLYSNPNGTGGALLRLERSLPYGPIYSISPGDITPAATRVSDGFPTPPVVDFASAKNPAGSVIGISPTFRSGYAQQFNLSVQHEIAPLQLVLKGAYVGNLGRFLGTTYNLNQPIPGTGSTSSRRPFFAVRPALADVTYAVADGLSNYNAFQFSAEKRFSHGLSGQFGYTWSKAIDDTGTEFGGGTGTPQDPRNRRADRGPSSSDLRHRATLAYLYQIPCNPKNLLGRLALGGWQTNGFLTFQTGLPFTAGLATNSLNTGTGSRPQALHSAQLAEGQRSLAHWFDTSLAGYTAGVDATTAAWGPNPPGLYGNAGRDTLYGPGRWNIDASLFKDFVIREAMKFQFRAEGFNIFNHPQFGQPNATVGSPSAGVISSTVGNPRQMQLALRFQF